MVPSDGGLTSPAGPTAQDLSLLLQHWRMRLNPRKIPGVDTGRRRLKPGLTQQEVATLTGVSVTWYRTLEGGVGARFSDAFLQRLAATLKLDESERTVLYQLAVGSSAPSAGPTRDVVVDAGLQALLDQMLPHPAYVTNYHWDIIAHNEPQAEWFPWIAYEPNIMRWVCLHLEAREQLVSWRTEWAAPFLAQLRVALARHPDDEILKSLRDDVIDGSPKVGEIWRQNESRLHPDGDIRHLRLPLHEGREVSVRILALTPLRNTDLRLVVLLPTERSVHGENGKQLRPAT